MFVLFYSIMKHNLLLFLIALAVFSAAPAHGQSKARTFDAQHYVIRTSFDRNAKTVFGETTAVVKPLANNFDSLTLDGANLTVERVVLEDSKQPLQFSVTGDKINVKLDKAYTPNDTVAVTIKYRAVNPKTGLYFIDTARAGNKTISFPHIWTQGEPEDNRHWFPSYDFPDDKATTEQIVTVAADETAIANGDLLEVKNNADNTKTFHFKMNVPHTTYLVSLIVGKYSKVEDKYGDVSLSYYVYPGTEAVVPKAYGKTKKMFELFEQKLGIKYPYSKYDQTVVGAFTFGGMENITVTTMADTEIYAALNTNGTNRDTENLVSHELAHSWFGNLVTMKDWSNLWLNEGFATFFEAVFIEQEYGKEEYLREMQRNAAYYMAEEALFKHPLLNLRAQPNSLLFDATTYKKGAVVIHQLRETVGEEVFWKALNTYLNRHKFTSVGTDDLQKVFEETSKQDLQWFFDQWVRKAGYPRLEITPVYNTSGKKLTINVKQTHKFDSQTPEFFRFKVNVEIVSPNGSKIETIEMNQREQTFTFNANVKPSKVNFDKNEQLLDVSSVKDVTLAAAASKSVARKGRK
jgi:aminopeptidase N